MYTSKKELIELAIQEQEKKSCKKSKKYRNDEKMDDYSEVCKLKEAGCKKANKEAMDLYQIKKSFLSECLYNLFDKSLGFQLESQEKDVMKRTLVNNFIEEQGLERLLSDFRSKSYLLSEYSRIVKESTDTVLKKCCDKEEIDIDFETKDDFYDKLDTEDTEEVANLIKLRVSNAVDEFLQTNMSDKIEIKEIIRKTEEKVNSSKNDAIKESYELAGKAAIAKVRNRNNKGILESMIFNVAKASLKDNDMKEMYMTEGSLDMDNIVEDCKIMYTFLEMINTTKMVNINESYINNIINSLKA